MLTYVSDKILMSLYRAKAPRDLATALFNFLSELIPDHHFQFLFLGGETEKPQMFCSDAPIYASFEQDLEEPRNRDDLWLASGLTPPEQQLKWKGESVCRKVTGQNLLHKELMLKTGAEHAVSFGLWKQGAWQACLTIVKTAGQGPFTVKDMSKLQDFRPHFQSAIERVIGLHEGDLYLHALETFIWSLPSAAIVLSWDLKLLYYNSSALELTECWKEGLPYAHTKKARALTLPKDILSATELGKTGLLAQKKNAKGGYKTFLLSEHQHPQQPELAVKIYFYPSHSGALNEGAFFINLQRQNQGPDEKVTYDSFASLSPRERDVVLLAAQGKKSGEIAERLGTASITVRMQLHSAYKKLGINTRYELVRMFTQSSNGHAPSKGQEPPRQLVPPPEVLPKEQLLRFFESLILLAAQLPQGVVLTDPTGEILWVNSVFTNLCGHPLDDLKGKKLGTCLLGEHNDAHAVNRFRHAIHEAKPCDCELIYEKKNQMPCHIAVQFRPITGPLGLMGAFALHQPVKS